MFFALAVAALAVAPIELTDDTFDASISKAGRTFVMFYAPWCSHCHALKPTWDALAENLDGKVQVARVDATKERTLSVRMSIRNYPTLIMYAPTDSFIGGTRAYVYKKTVRGVEALEAFAVGGYLSLIHI